MHAPATTPAIRSWALAAGILTAGTAGSAIGAAAILDALIQRPAGGGSVTTLVPGFVYAAAAVMRVCLLAGWASAIVAVIVSVPGCSSASSSASATRQPGLPRWGFASIMFAPLTPFAGAIAVVLVQALAPVPLSFQDFTYVSRTAVFVTLTLLFAGVVTAILSLTRLERPRLLAVLGLLVNGLLIGLFWHLEFYAIGFDQDTWAH